MGENILDYTLQELEESIIELGEKKFRAAQIFPQIHDRNIRNFDEFKNIPKELSEKLKSKFEIRYPELIEVRNSSIDRTKKFLFGIPGTNEKIESVLISEKGRNTICVSTQAGCNAGCEFCATGKMGFKKNLSAGEILAQIYTVTREIGEKPSNIVYMGMGEPFLNYDNVIKSLKIITDEKGYGLSSRKITVSTIGFTGKIKKFAEDLTSVDNKLMRNIKLALSLHSTDRGLREKIIPLSKINPLPKIFEELNYFYKTTKNKVTFEYIYFEGLNDTENDIKRLTKLVKMFPSNINLIPFHPIDFPMGAPLERYSGKEFSLSKDKIFDFIEKLKKNGVIVNLRNSAGVDIYAACGQLAGRNQK
ncbi:MAG: 23S rRNA (adenine(2503)-C(2))-methyltransferase RlmN [Ignavibacteriae bacterium]|nr:23S rRNA (adenine(2503)-C(2))-methyltransferase RlmN [Ignavibacteriota bacterium]